MREQEEVKLARVTDLAIDDEAGRTKPCRSAASDPTVPSGSGRRTNCRCDQSSSQGRLFQNDMSVSLEPADKSMAHA